MTRPPFYPADTPRLDDGDFEALLSTTVAEVQDLRKENAVLRRLAAAGSGVIDCDPAICTDTRAAWESMNRLREAVEEWRLSL